MRTPPQSVPIRETGLDINQPVSQTIQSRSEPTQIGVMENGLQDDIIVSSPRTHQQPDEVGVRMMDMGTNTSDVEVRTQRHGVETPTVDTNVQTSILFVDGWLPTSHADHVRIPHVNLSIMGYDQETLQTLVGAGSLSIRAPKISPVPQLDGPVSLPRRDLDRG